jgi:hypothetical protein
MKKYLPIIMFLLISIMAKAQKYQFVYLQTDNKQPFYVKIKDKVLSSSQSGYLVIPKLLAGDYAIKVGFPKDQWPQQSFNVNIANADAGYLLKNFAEKGWGLYNMQTMEIVMNGAAATKDKTAAENDDAFAATLSGATNTELTVKKAPVVEPAKQVEKKTAVEKVVANKATSSIQKLSTENEADGKSIVYAINTNNVIDTVTVFIPAETVVVKEAVAKKAEPIKKATEKKEKFLDIEMQNPNTTIADKSKAVEKTEPTPVVETAATKSVDKPLVAFNSDCRAFATEDDFYKGRKKMAVEDNDEGMVDAAKKFLKLKCYSVEQIKNLSQLFLNDAGRYNFFDAAYPHTSDSQNFGSLQTLLKETYYVNRFKAMIRN